jgi:hypothetical protein
MQFLEGNFWFYGTEMRWKVPVPFCPACDVAMLEHLLPGESIH